MFYIFIMGKERLDTFSVTRDFLLELIRGGNQFEKKNINFCRGSLAFVNDSGCLEQYE